jgi:hypothetical protein
MDRKQDVEESALLYDGLLLKAFSVCTEIVRYPKPRDPSAIRIWEVSRAVVECGSPPRSIQGPLPWVGAAFEALDKLCVDWPEFWSGASTGEIAYASCADLWRRLMYESPMGTYASMAAGFINDRLSVGQKLIELGAGVGNTSRLLKIPPSVLYLRTDRSLTLLTQQALPGTPQRYDFDVPSSITAADIVFAVNALHCAENPRKTLSYIHAMLCRGGLLVLAEGEPRPAGNRPWALDVLFCQFSGWCDRTGFRARSRWIDDLVAEGYTHIGYQRLVAGEYDLGGLIWATS